jgi:hypothetical protein
MGFSLADMIVAAVAKQTEVESASLRLVTLRGKQWMHETTLGEHHRWPLSWSRTPNLA